MRTFFQAVREEFGRIFSDRGALLLLVAAVVFYSFVYPLPYRPQVPKEMPIVAVDLDRSASSRRLIRMADATELVEVRKRTTEIRLAEREVREGRAAGILIVPEEFERKLLRVERPTVEILADAAYILVYRQVLTGLVQAAATLSAGVEIRKLRVVGVPQAAARARRDPLPLVQRPLFNPSTGYATYVVPAVLLLILQQTLLIGIGLLAGTARERGEEPTWSAQDGENECPWSRCCVVLGRAAAYFSLSFVHCIFYFGILTRLYRFPHRGEPLALLLFLVPFLLSVVLLGLALSSLFKHRETAMQTLLFTSLPAVFLAGFSWPQEAIPRWLGLVAHLLPSTAGIPGFLRIQQMGASLGQVLKEWIVLWGLCALYLGLALWSVCKRGSQQL